MKCAWGRAKTVERQTNNQLELFSDSSGLNEPRRGTLSNSALSRIWKYEKTILLTISIVTTGLVSFSLGVERGKRLALLKNNSRVENNKPVVATTPDKASAVINPSGQEAPVQQKAPQQKEPVQAQDFAIQLASYKMMAHAQKEAEILKKMGLSPIILSKGSYIVLYVGKLSNKEAAQSLLSELKKRYRDCIIRRL
jgi:hypothetical protein